MSDNVWIGLQSHFTIIPNHIARDESLSIEARGLFALLASHASGWKFKRTQLMKACACGREKFDRMVRELKDANILQIERTRAENGVFSGWNWSISTECLETRMSVKPYVGKPDIHKKNNTQEDQLEEPTPLKIVPPNSKADPTDGEFEKVWTIYPKKQAKGAARKAWKKARSKIGFEGIARPLAEFIKVIDGTPVEFIPQFSTWLNQERWEDDQSHARNRPATGREQINDLSTLTGAQQIENLWPALECLQ